MFLSIFLHTVVCIHKKIEVQKIFEKNKHLNIILIFFNFLVRCIAVKIFYCFLLVSIIKSKLI